MMNAKMLAIFASVIPTLVSPAFAQTSAGPGGQGNGSPVPSQSTRCVFSVPSDYGFTSKQECLAFFDAGGRMWDFVDDYKWLTNPTLDRWGFQTWSYRRAPYATPTTGVLLTDKSSIENGTWLEWNTYESPNARTPIVSLNTQLRIGAMHPGLGGASPLPLVSVVDWKGWQAGSYEVRVDMWPADGNLGHSPDIGWNIYRDGPGGFSMLDGGLMAHVVGQHTTRTLFLSLAADDHVYLAIDPGSNPNASDSSFGDTVAFKLTILRPGQ